MLAAVQPPGPYRTCPKCGGEGPRDAQFCVWCGVAAGGVAASRAQVTVPSLPTTHRSVWTGIRDTWTQATPAQRWAALVVGVATLAAGVAIWLAPIGPDVSPEPETGTLAVNEPAP